ncbi:redoxin domain-containing protein [Galbibacter sp. PAP.153]|uniref:TlpA disulfide reductase family protein n=1 Tax=Galbibacter sp. PAP.153 TaxID=3104623 RepID=UPI003009E914
MKRIAILLCVLALTGCKEQKNEPAFALASIEKVTPLKIIETNAKTIPVYNFNSLEKLLKPQDDKIYVVNFWATWCKPCVEELPNFEKAYKQYKKEGVEVILVSLDFPNKVNEILIPFINKKNLISNVILLDDPKQNRWIPKVDENWSGAIPATIIISENKRSFYEKSFTFIELEKEIKDFVNN